MALNKKSDIVLAVGGSSLEGQSGVGQLTDAEIAKLADETAGQLLALGGGEAKDGIDRGRIIDGFVRRLQPNGKGSEPNPFSLLAEREDIPWGASQLRLYRDAYLLWRQMG